MVPALEPDLACLLDALDLVVGQAGTGGGKVPPFQFDDLRSTNRPEPFRSGAVPIQDDRVHEAVRIPPSELIEDFARGPTHCRPIMFRTLPVLRHIDHSHVSPCMTSSISSNVIGCRSATHAVADVH